MRIVPGRWAADGNRQKAGQQASARNRESAASAARQPYYPSLKEKRPSPDGTARSGGDRFFQLRQSHKALPLVAQEDQPTMLDAQTELDVYDTAFHEAAHAVMAMMRGTLAYEIAVLDKPDEMGRGDTAR